MGKTGVMPFLRCAFRIPINAMTWVQGSLNVTLSNIDWCNIAGIAGVCLRLNRSLS